MKIGSDQGSNKQLTNEIKYYSLPPKIYCTCSYILLAVFIKISFDVQRSKGISKISSNIIGTKLPPWRLFFNSIQFSVKLLHHLGISSVQVNYSVANESPQNVICHYP